MSDDLKKLMRAALVDYEAAGVSGSEGARAMREGLNRIEELEGQVAGLLRQASDNHDALTRAEAAEARLAKAVETLSYIARSHGLYSAEKCLAELGEDVA